MKLCPKLTTVPTDQIIVKVNCTDEWFNDCHYMIFDLSKLKRQVAKAIITAEELKKKMEWFYDIRLHCFAGDWLNDNNLDDEFFADEPLEDKSWSYIEPLTEEEIEVACEDLRTEVEMIIVDENNVRFDCYVKNCNIVLETDHIKNIVFL